jgi:hypothetical protein
METITYYEIQTSQKINPYTFDSLEEARDFKIEEQKKEATFSKLIGEEELALKIVKVVVTREELV